MSECGEGAGRNYKNTEFARRKVECPCTWIAFPNQKWKEEKENLGVCTKKIWYLIHIGSRYS